MVDIPEELARAIQAGDCVLWVGAGIGALCGRPGWESLLSSIVKTQPDEVRSSLEDLVEQGRLRTVLGHVLRHQGDEPLVRRLAEIARDDGEGLREEAATLASFPWKACFSTLYTDVLRRVFSTDGGREVPVLEHTSVHHLSLRDRQDFFILQTPVTESASRADAVLFDLVEEVVRTRTILFLGFEPDDPDLAQALELMSRIGRGEEHFAVLPYMSKPEGEEWRERYGIRVLHVAHDTPLAAVSADLRHACDEVAVRPSDVDGKLAVLDLIRAVRGIAARADLATDDALALPPDRIEHLLDALPRGSLAAVPSMAALRAGCVLLAHGRIDRARRCFQAVSSRDAGRELTNLARFDLAMTALAEGDRSAALEAFADCASSDRSLALVPPRFEVEEAYGWSGGRMALRVRDRESKEQFDLEVATLSRPVGRDEEAAFSRAVQALAAVSHPAVGKVRGGFADGRLFGVTYEPIPGFVLADTLAQNGAALSPERVLELADPLIEGLETCHARGVLHRSLVPDAIVVGPEGPVVRGFGFPPVVGLGRPSVMKHNRGYLAPELEKGGASSPASDVFALAAVLYRCLTGVVPEGSVPAPSSLREDLDPRFDPLLQGALHPEPGKRLPLGELKRQLRHIVSTPELGRAQRLLGEQAEPGEERVVDLGGPSMAAQSGSSSSYVARQAPSPTTGAKVIEPEDEDDLQGWVAVLEHKPTHLGARQAVTRLEADARQSRAWDALAEILAVRARFTQLHQERLELLRELAALYEKELSAPASAFETLTSLAASADSSVRSEVIPELLRLTEVTGAWPQLASSLESLASREPEAHRQAQLYDEVARVVADRVGDAPKAIEVLERAVELEPTAERHRHLTALRRKHSEPAELAASLLGLADHEEGTPRHDALVEAARIMWEQLEDEEGAYATVELVLGEAPNHADALALAESLARSQGRSDVLLSVLQRRAELDDETEAVAKIRREAASLAISAGDREGAIDHLSKLLERDRTDREAAERLVELIQHQVDREPEHRLAYIDALEVLAELATSPEEAALLLERRAAELDEEPDGRAQAIDSRERLLTLVPMHRDVAMRAAEALRKSYAAGREHERLRDLFIRQAKAEDLPEEHRVSAWTEVLELCRGPLSDAQGEIEALEELSRLSGDNEHWRDQLLELYLSREQFQKAGALIRAQVYEEEDPKRKAALLLQGGLLREKIGKTQAAIEALEEAVGLDPSLTKAWLTLSELYATSDQPLKAVEALVAAGRGHPNRAERSRLLFDAAKRYLGELERPERAVETLEEVVEVDPDHREATRILVERLVEAGELERAWPHVQTLVLQVRSSAQVDNVDLLQAMTMAGRCAVAVGEKSKAHEYLEKARSMDPTNLELLRLLGDLDLESAQWQDALRHYQSVVLGASDLSPTEQADLYTRMGLARLGMDERTKAMSAFERALEHDPTHELAGKKLVELAEHEGRPEDVVRARLKLVDLLERRESEEQSPEALESSRSRRSELLREVATLQLEQLEKPKEAIATLERALQIDPDDPALLHRALEAYSQSAAWEDALRVLRALAEAQEDPQIQAKYLYAGAVILRDNVDDQDRALDWFAEVLQDDPSHDKSLDALVSGLKERGRDKDLARTIRGYLKVRAAQADPERLVSLFDELGDTYLRLGEPKTALAALDQAAKLATKSGEGSDAIRERREKVMRIAVSVGDDALDKAVAHGHGIIAANPMDFEVYHRLVELYLKQGNRDRARCLSRTLKFLKQADDAELELADALPSAVRGTLSRDHWRRNITHPAEDARLSEIFSVVWPMVVARDGRTHEHVGLSLEQRTEVSLQSHVGVSRYLAYACQVFDVAVPDFFVGETTPGGIRIDALASEGAQGRSVHPTVIAGKDALADHSEVSMKFRAGRAIARLRPDHIMTAVLASPVSLRHVLYGAIHVSFSDAPLPEDVFDAAEAYANVFASYLQPARAEQLKILCKPLVESDTEPDIRGWLQGAAFTSNRAAFVLCDSLEVAAQLLTREGDDGSAISAKEKIRDLIAYSVSDPYLRLRKDVGLTR